MYGSQFYVDGESASLLCRWMQVSSIKRFCTTVLLFFSTRMSALEVSVRHDYRDTKRIWSSKDNAGPLNMRQSSTRLLHQVAASLLNFYFSHHTSDRDFHVCAIATFYERYQLSVSPYLILSQISVISMESFSSDCL